MHLNGDESTSYGTAYMVANSTAGVRIKKVILNDGPNYAIDLKLNFQTSPPKTQTLFSEKTNYGTKKKMNISKLQENLHVILS